jgi:methionine-rich copper-binding protein CopC
MWLRALVAIGGFWLTGALPHPHFHLALKRAEPGINDTLTASPAAVKLWFTQSVQAASTAMRVTAADGRVIQTGPITVDTARLSPAVAVVSEQLPAGTYTVAWKTMAADGHAISGKYSFTVRPTAELRSALTDSTLVHEPRSGNPWPDTLPGARRR